MDLIKNLTKIAPKTENLSVKSGVVSTIFDHKECLAWPAAPLVTSKSNLASPAAPEHFLWLGQSLACGHTHS